jgi:hypothetical protein
MAVIPWYPADTQLVVRLTSGVLAGQCVMWTGARWNRRAKAVRGDLASMPVVVSECSALFPRPAARS